MDIQHTDNGTSGLFFVELDGKEKARITYRHTGDQQITIDHTEVNDELKGEGVGHKLINAMVDYLRKNNLKAVAECPFVKSVFDKKSDEFSDVRA